ncbi:2-phospho-L-lactate guanylyltransferase [Dermatophilaceae bacterium Soc4.6]
MSLSAPEPTSEPTGQAHPGWVVVVPVKGGPLAKSRLRAPDGVDHARLATALALDTVAAAVAALGPARVVVVTSDPGIAAAVVSLGALAQADPGDGLDAAVLAGGARAAALPQAEPARVAALLGDLPCLHADDLRAALVACEGDAAAFVPDADGVGTVLLTSAAGHRLRPRFGGGSAHAHEGQGARRLDLDLPRLRRDVDDEDSLRAALCLGVGTHTATLLAHLVVPGPAPSA